MNAQTNEDLVVQVVKFLNEQLRIPKKKILLENSLFHDFGVDGDDAVELLQEYSALFDVSIDDFEIEKYFGPEDSSSPIKMFVEMFTKSNLHNIPRFTVNDLVQGAAIGKLKK